MCLQVQSKTEATEFKLSSSTGRFLDLEREVDELQQKTLETSSSADDAQRQAEYITAETDHTEQVTGFYSKIHSNEIYTQILEYIILC